MDTKKMGINKEEAGTPKRGRPRKQSSSVKPLMVRVTFDSDNDRKVLVNYLTMISKGRSIGRVIRDLIDSHRKEWENIEIPF